MFGRHGPSSLWPALLFAGVRLALADPTPQAPANCEVTAVQEAKAFADTLFEKGEYQHAGVCYQAAGDMTHANLAYLKAVGPKGSDTAQGLRQQRDQAKALFAGVEHAFHNNH